MQVLFCDLNRMARAVGVWLVLASPVWAEEPPKFLLAWGTRGDGPGEFYSPIHVALDAADEVIVTDLNNGRVQRFDTSGRFLSEFALPMDTPPRKSCMAGGLAVRDDGTLLVSFMIQHKVVVYSRDGTVVREWGRKGTGNGEFNQPGGMVIGDDGTIYVADQCNHRVQVFTRDGQFVCVWGGHGSEPGQFGGMEAAGSRFAGPHFLARDQAGQLYTTEGVLGRVQRLATDGRPLAAWGSKTVEPGAFGEYQFGKQKFTFGPIGVMVDRRGRVWVSSLNDRVQCFQPDGTFLFKLEETDADHPFLHPHGMATDKAGNVYILDSGNQRVVKFGMK